MSHTVESTEIVNFKLTLVQDNSLAPEQIKHVQEGKNGKKVIIYQVNNWIPSIKKVKSESIIEKPVDNVIARGPNKSATSTNKLLIESSKKINECTKTGKCASTTVDSGYQAGYDWAEENNICDPNYSSGNSESFNDGVRDWTDTNCNDDL